MTTSTEVAEMAEEEEARLHAAEKCSPEVSINEWPIPLNWSQLLHAAASGPGFSPLLSHSARLLLSWIVS